MSPELMAFCAYCYPGRDEEGLRRAYGQMIRFTRKRLQTGFYTALRLPKPGGGERVVLAPSPGLKRAQAAAALLLAAEPVSPYACAYRKGVSLRDNAAPHTGAPLLLKTDLRDFFGSVRFPAVYRAFDGALHRAPPPFLARRPEGEPYPLSFFLARLCTCEGSLPQGSPASPVLSNLAFAACDRRIAAYCGERGISYTRYSDDLTFSGKFSAEALLRFLDRLLEDSGFSRHPGKTAAAGPGARHRVTGLSVSDRVLAPREFRRAIRQEFYYIQKFGLAPHLARRGGPDSPEAQEAALAALLGRVSFVLQMDPQNRDFLRYRALCLGPLRDAVAREYRYRRFL